MTAWSTLHVVESLVAVVLLLQTLEYWALRSQWQAGGVWSWSIARLDFVRLPAIARYFFDFIYRDKNFSVLLLLRGLICVSFFLSGGEEWGMTVAGVQLVLSWLVLLRWRGAFNGGSDFLAMIILLAVSVAHGASAAGRNREFWAQAALGYIAIQVGLSYFLAGVAKIRHPEWRSGLALEKFLKTSVYFSHGFLRGPLETPWVVRGAARVVLAFEVLFPLCFFSGAGSGLWLLSGAIFHAINFYVFGLNRFFWIWLATYPAVYFFSVHVFAPVF